MELEKLNNLIIKLLVLMYIIEVRKAIIPAAGLKTRFLPVPKAMISCKRAS
ncbi:hypothetical protein [Bacillus sp. C1]